MRLRPLIFAFFVAGLAWSAQAQTGTPDASPDSQSDQLDPRAARQQYEQSLSEQCPQKQLQMLSPRDLSDGLDQYKSGVPADLRAAMSKAEVVHCSSLDAGETCVNTADIAAAGAAGHMDDVALSICTTFLRCHDQGQCDYAR